MNLYVFSKHLSDLAVADRFANGASPPPQWVGLKFFNVFGPNEYHKGEMTSLVAKRFDEAQAGKCVRLFKSHRDGVADGEQKRDFIYVDDAVAVMRWLLDTPSVSGIFNVGTGKARSFRDLITAMFRALGREPAIEYVDMPAAIRRQYQYFTQAKVENLRRAGYNAGFTPLEEGANRYVTLFLNQADHAQGSLRFRASFDPFAARRLGIGASAQSQDREGPGRSHPGGVAACGERRPVRLCQGHPDSAGHSGSDPRGEKGKNTDHRRPQSDRLFHLSWRDGDQAKPQGARGTARRMAGLAHRLHQRLFRPPAPRPHQAPVRGTRRLRPAHRRPQ